MKKLNAMIVGLALLAGLQSIRSQIPSLSITQVGGQSLLYWPFSETSPLSLESTTSLQSGLWTPEANAVRVDAYIVTNTSPTKFFRLIPSWQVAIPSGMFTMGNTLTNDTDLDDAIPTNVYVSKFYMDKNLVALAQWQPVFDWATNHGYRFEDWAYDGYNWLTNHGSGVTGVSLPVTGTTPAVGVDWFTCVKWCNARSELAGLTPAYYTDSTLTQVYRTGENAISNACVNWAANGYRLPTEAEWEWAARGGLSGQRFPWGDTISRSQANYAGDTNSYFYDLGPNGPDPAVYDTTNNIFILFRPGGFFPPNGYGLYDMAGNAFSWCWDGYTPVYAGGIDPHGPDGMPARVFRGGGFFFPASVARCAARSYFTPQISINSPTPSLAIGFRCVRGQ